MITELQAQVRSLEEQLQQANASLRKTETSSQSAEVWLRRLHEALLVDVREGGNMTLQIIVDALTERNKLRAALELAVFGNVTARDQQVMDVEREKKISELLASIDNEPYVPSYHRMLQHLPGGDMALRTLAAQSTGNISSPAKLTAAPVTALSPRPNVSVKPTPVRAAPSLATPSPQPSPRTTANTTHTTGISVTAATPQDGNISLQSLAFSDPYDLMEGTVAVREKRLLEQVSKLRAMRHAFAEKQSTTSPRNGSPLTSPRSPRYSPAASPRSPRQLLESRLSASGARQRVQQLLAGADAATVTEMLTDLSRTALLTPHLREALASILNKQS